MHRDPPLLPKGGFSGPKLGDDSAGGFVEGGRPKTGGGIATPAKPVCRRGGADRWDHMQFRCAVGSHILEGWEAAVKIGREEWKRLCAVCRYEIYIYICGAPLPR